jgi:hypothetical protein
MPTDVRLMDEDVTIDAVGGRVQVLATDFSLVSENHKTGTHGLRRALVHSEQDALVLNFGGDYPGGVRVHGAMFVGRLPGADGEDADVLWKPDKVAHPDNPVGGAPDVDGVFEELAHPSPLDVEVELRVLRAAVVRLLERVQALETAL